MKLASALLAGLLAIGLQAHDATAAETYPTRAVKIIVAYPAGGANDIVARSIAEELSRDLGQPVVIENKSGAAGVVGAEAAAHATPDGYTLLMAAGAHTLAPSLNAKLPYDIVTDFQPISLAATSTYLLVVNPSVPARSVKELVALAKSRPGQLNFGSFGIGNVTHLAAELLRVESGIRMEHVPSKGETAALTGIISGEVALLFAVSSAAAPHIHAGRAR